MPCCDVCKDQVSEVRDVGGQKMCSSCFLQQFQDVGIEYRRKRPEVLATCDLCGEPDGNLKATVDDLMLCAGCFEEYVGDEMDGADMLDASDVIEGDSETVQSLHSFDEDESVKSFDTFPVLPVRAESEDALVVLEQHRIEIRRLEGAVKKNMLEIGRHLYEVRQELHYKNGGFRQWIEDELGWSYQTAYNFLSVFERFGSLTNFERLALPHSAWYALAAESTPEEARQAVLERAEQGEQLTFRQVEEMIQEFRGKATISRIGKSRTRMTSKTGRAGLRDTPQTVCAFCQGVNMPVYVAGVGSSVGICRGCAVRAVEALQK